MLTCQRWIVACMMLLTAWGTPHAALAWHAGGHARISQGAIGCLPQEMPAFFRSENAQQAVAHGSIDPDAFKHPMTAQLTQSEEPEHFLDLEMLDGATLPDQRYAYLAMCHEKKLDPQKVGLLPYAIAEWTQRLTMALAEHRQWPQDIHIQNKCLVYAGILAHYTGDLVQPLHCTLHHDGRAKANGASPRAGIHHKVDHAIEALELDVWQCTKDLTPETITGPIIPAIAQAIAESNRLVDRVYELQAQWPSSKADHVENPDPAMRELTIQRLRAGASLTAGLYLRAWNDSAAIQLPAWLKKERQNPSVLPDARQ